MVVFVPIGLCRKWDLDERFLESRRRSILREHQQLSGRHRNFFAVDGGWYSKRFVLVWFEIF